MQGKIFKEEIEKIFKEARDKYPDITDKDLDTNGAIHYMNGNDGTDFDWSVNDRLCEFMIFHQDERGFIKVFVGKNNAADVYIYETGDVSPTQKYQKKLNVPAEEFASLMYEITDAKGLFDRPIDDLDWNVDSVDHYIENDGE